MAPSKLIFTIFTGGGSQRLWDIWQLRQTCVSISCLFIWKLFRLVFNAATTWWRAVARTCKRTWFRWFQTDHAVSSKRSSCLPSNIIHETRSLKSVKPTEFWKFHNDWSAQTISSSVHDHKASALQRSQIELAIMVLITKACFVGMAFPQALHITVFTFYGTCIDQMAIQTCLSLSGGTWFVTSISASSLRKR